MKLTQRRGEVGTQGKEIAHEGQTSDSRVAVSGCLPISLNEREFGGIN
ncbi:MAG: hypothetical protein KME32_12700 [Mojavia pulchra JT2-VF2]|jgi:hypothetical protein|uniref:Uncharacterized protein n=1 Tax=Mojavia pulchra JT2-VF2 TaxID=287848 RepID=A0A951PX69_9NOST|nr:hypothetical protein [Mojavia pulchra JT2-VF2]